MLLILHLILIICLNVFRIIDKKLKKQKSYLLLNDAIETMLNISPSYNFSSNLGNKFPFG